uniref:Putative secreted protein n=1 Tax=Ixodes ricinus TaxID=34613 RepID=A0A6B0UE19_IXORI
MFSKIFSLQGFAVQLIQFLYNHASAVISGRTSRPRHILTSVVTHGTSAWETGVAPLKPLPQYVSAPKWKSRAVPQVAAAGEMVALCSPLARF